ncbi:nucleoside 2-deoxyribosyltransferase [Acidocella aromatica]|uniref:Nucleoside 2-deoxyribosyltransferase n=1 Tax=Acidocella aromatica TaxID=1303579 RepID=A0A840VC15_9PROT|nr:nucleoside 2-deoxyribosyltransferase [Acidocella aromatica]MBB5373246.1 nucleoside 2-deoxyribosyltransferase [Acidocella aromatica]
MPAPKAYLAGPDVFLPNAAAQAEAKIAICARHGLTGISPFNPALDTSPPPETLWRRIYLDDIAMMQGCGLIIANLTPFRGASADAGTLVELGWFLGRGLPVFGYSNNTEDFAARSLAQITTSPDSNPGMAVENFGLADNLMIQGAVEYGGGIGLTLPPDGLSRPFDALDVFELCVAEAARKLTG